MSTETPSDESVQPTDDERQPAQSDEGGASTAAPSDAPVSQTDADISGTPPRDIDVNAVSSLDPDLAIDLVRCQISLIF